MAAINYSDNVANVSSVLVNPGPSVLYEYAGQNLSGGTLFVQVFDKVALPPAGVPLYSYKVLDQQTFAFAPPAPLNDKGRKMTLGIVIAYSTTQATYTAPGAAAGTLFAAFRTTTL